MNDLVKCVLGATHNGFSSFQPDLRKDYFLQGVTGRKKNNSKIYAFPSEKDHPSEVNLLFVMNWQIREYPSTQEEMQPREIYRPIPIYSSHVVRNTVHRSLDHSPETVRQNVDLLETSTFRPPTGHPVLAVRGYEVPKPRREPPSEDIKELRDSIFGQPAIPPSD